jgi:hypothetical protein
MASLVVALVVLLSALAQRRATQWAVTGTVAEFKAGEWITLVDSPMEAPIALRKATTYAGNPAAIMPGSRVTVWWRSVGEPQPVADKVRVLADAASH